jgi:flavodoxin
MALLMNALVVSDTLRGNTEQVASYLRKSETDVVVVETTIKL